MDPNYCLNGVGWPCLTQNAWAAWVQAIGSILAIIVAVWVPSRLAKIERSERRERDAASARSHGLLLGHRIDRLAAALRHIRSQLVQWEPGLEDDQFQKHMHRLENLLGDWLLQSHELGAASKPVQGALSDTIELIAILDEFDTYARFGPVFEDYLTGETEPVPEPRPYRETLDRAIERLEQAAKEVRGSFDSL